VRNRIKTARRELTLSLPVKRTRSRDDLLIKDAELDYSQNWKANHLASIRHNYRQAPFFTEVYPFLEDLFRADVLHLADWNIHLVRQLVGKMGMEQTSFFRSSELPGVRGAKGQRLIGIMKTLGRETLLAAGGSSAYLRAESPNPLFDRAGMVLHYQVYSHPVYPQLHGTFLPFMSLLDLLCNVGFKRSLAIIRSGRPA
jgi:hypothetical protein